MSYPEPTIVNFHFSSLFKLATFNFNMQQVLEKISCYHCGDDCKDASIALSEKYFCCEGCKLVFEILQENNLCTYYSLNNSPGVHQQKLTGTRYNFLDESSISQKIISFRNKNEVHVTFHIPAMHCSSCIWLLENFQRVVDGIILSRVDFIKKEISLVFDENKTSLRKVVEALAQTGYEPSLHLGAIESKERKKVNRSRIIRIGVAGFCFGNIMMMSFPEYFSSGKISDSGLKEFFSYMNLALSLPVFFYSASEFFIKSYRAIKHKSTSIDIPIALGIAAIFLRSTYEILTQTGAGYFDSGSGLVFFMLIGRWFQDYTFDSLSFDRDYKSYFPIAVTTIKNGVERETIVNDLKVSDRILVRNNEIIPVDAVLLKGTAHIDYHFVTGESVPVHHTIGETVFAGGKQAGSIIELQVTKEISQSHLTQLWNKNSTPNKLSRFDKLVQAISKYFILGTLLIAFAAAAYWWNTDIHKAVNAFTAVLVIACPCALALSAPFTYGNMLRILGKNKIYLRDYRVLEKLADVNAIVFDKTGTITENNAASIKFIGDPLSKEEYSLVYSLVKQSSHPLSRLLGKWLNNSTSYKPVDFKEEIGQGISAFINGTLVKAGNYRFTGSSFPDNKEINQTKVYISINDESKGYFTFNNTYRTGLSDLTKQLLDKNYALSVLTGDNESEKNNLKGLFRSNTHFLFNQSPTDKLNYISRLKEDKKNVLMLGDGLNDAGALMQSDVSISVADNTNTFTPASDAILDAGRLRQLCNLLSFAKSAVRIIVISFIISLLYNFVGLSFAVSGTLSPLTAAILMPISTISLVLFTVSASTLTGKKLKFN